ncbi:MULTISPECIES: amidohydrolase family protein [unclassified Undibacterium]|uniref:metal-dependent hydrolase family protein n=2 Tax=Pseudomonadota TaxID=1224 RepID=UPI002AC950F6|nr:MULTISPECIES: amidohydrolase family protein [unclassified Undibacterium]MEB0140110.1 amidohydrolase family protein [Undibacterium sp. CCC2.1]MEB0173220.1 amidohydrolase family protein [Undibacterium sp. CCC1.1]MEB0176919.1 amidohydrolase family protein [Undibacterium sp. CCC3.4]MEB0216252.1 amidohydrolase family protein [Undibacterium sp. 5I2]WPX44156.1 amidohydrolase family protein [Undibacterium sp. CCC3.4]
MPSILKTSTVRIMQAACLMLAFTQNSQAEAVLFQQVRIFDGTGTSLSAPSDVLVDGKYIVKISRTPLQAAAGSATRIIQGKGRTLMPGLIDAHTHLMFATVPQMVLLTADIGYINVAAVKAAADMLQRGFTSVRDLGGPVFGLKRGIDSGLVPGPRIWPSGAFLSQTGGHGDFRFPNEFPIQAGASSYAERVGATVIADNADTVRMRSRELLALGATQLKLMAGGGVSSSMDPLDVTQYTVEELRAAVEAAANWGTYVTVHAYTPRAVRQAIEAGVQCIDHGQLLDEATAQLMAKKGIWWSLQPFLDDGHSSHAEGSSNRKKELEMVGGTEHAYALAKKYQIKTAWGTDILFSAQAAAKQGQQLVDMLRWYTPAEALKMATADNAALLALSGARSPYAGKLGVVQEGALADLLLVDGDPLAHLQLVADPGKNFLVIMKDGQIYKNSLP